MFSRFLVLITLLLSTPLLAGKKHDMCAWDCSDTDENFQKGIADVLNRFHVSDEPQLFASTYSWSTEEQSYTNMTLPPEELAKITEILCLTSSDFSLKTIDNLPYVQVRAHKLLSKPNGTFRGFLNFCGFKQSGHATQSDVWHSMPYIYAPDFKRGWTHLKEDFAHSSLTLLFSTKKLSEAETLRINASFLDHKGTAPSHRKRKAKQEHAHPKRIKQETNDEDPQIKSTASQVSPSLPRAQDTTNVSIPEENKATSKAGESTLSPNATRFRSGVKPKSAWTSRQLHMSEDTYAQYRSRWIDAMQPHQETSHEAAINTLSKTMETQLTFPHTHQGNHPHSLSESYFQLLQITRGDLWYETLKKMGLSLAMEFIQFDKATNPQNRN